MDLGLLRNELSQDAAETQRLLAERRSNPVVTGGRRVALVEDQVDDLEHRRQTGGEFGPARDLERDARLAKGPLRPHDALGDGRLRDEERARDLRGLQPPEQAERERNARLGREHRMAGYEDEAEEVVPHVVEGRVEIHHGPLLLGLELATEFLVLALRQLDPAQPVDRAMFRSGHEPGTRVIRDTRLRPPLQRDHQSVLRQVLRHADVAHDPSQPGDELG